MIFFSYIKKKANYRNFVKEGKARPGDLVVPDPFGR